MWVSAQCVAVGTDSARLGGHVRARRNALGLTQREAAVKAGIATQTWINVEQGEKVKERTLVKVDTAMRWTPGSAAAVLRGGEPTIDDSVAPSAAEEIAALRAELEKLRGKVEDMDRQRS